MSESAYGLSEDTRTQISCVLARFPEVERATLFGSRAKGSHRAGSDIDLALVGTALDWRMLGRIEDAFDVSSLPYRFSLLHHNAGTDPEVAAHIARVGREIYVAERTLEKA
ncbi:MAG: nucleotidyltransferase domain-containing protein [Opitutaceae bacterium]|nr:nucleotidyltransferase domain-containing protein [Opitutaceae bacterium]